MVSFPYHSHIFRDSYGSGMGIVWEAYHKGVPLLGVPGITLDWKLGSKVRISQWVITLIYLIYKYR